MRPSDHGPLALPNRSPLESLADRMARAVERGRKIQLSASELDWFAVSGALKALSDAATIEIVEKAKRRLLEQGEDLSFLEPRQKDEGRDGLHPPTTPSQAFTPETFDDERPRPPFTPASLAARWGVSPSTIYSRINSGALPHFRLGSLYRIRHQDVLDYEHTHDVKGKPLPKL